MLRFCLLIALGFLAAGAAFSDIAGVSVSGSGSGTGDLIIEGCPSVPHPPPCDSPLSFGASNNSLGAFSTSGSTSLGEGGSITGEADQTITATSSGFTIDLQSTETGLGGAVIADMDMQVTNSVQLDFDLTTESVLELTSSGGGPAQPLTLSGSQGNVFSTPPDPGAFDVLLTLDPGTYSLSESLTPLFITRAFGNLFGNASFEQDYTVSAEFTAIPEPRWTLIVPALLLAVGGWIGKRSL